MPSDKAFPSKDQTEYSYIPERRKSDEASTTLPAVGSANTAKPFRKAKDTLRALSLTGTSDASGTVSDRVRLGQMP